MERRRRRRKQLLEEDKTIEANRKFDRKIQRHARLHDQSNSVRIVDND